MSTFKKRLAEIRNARMNKVAEGEDQNQLEQEFIQLIAKYGLDITTEDLRQAELAKGNKFTPYTLFLRSPMLKDFLDNDVMNSADTQEAAQKIIDKVNEMYNDFTSQGFSKWWSCSEQEVRKLELQLPNTKPTRQMGRRMTGPEAVVMRIYNGEFKFQGLGVISEFEDEELEKMAKELVAEFETKVRSMLASLSKKNK